MVDGPVKETSFFFDSRYQGHLMSSSFFLMIGAPGGVKEKEPVDCNRAPNTFPSFLSTRARSW